MISRLLRLLVALTLLASFACGGDDGGESSDASGSASAPEETSGGDGDGGGEGGDEGDGGGDTVSASAYADSICSGVGEWFDAIQANTDQLDTATDELEGDLDGAKESIQGYLDEVIAATDELLEEVDGAGAPDVEDGEEVAVALKEGFENVKGEFEGARDEIDAVSTDDPDAFVAEFERIGGRLQDGSALEDAFSGLERFSDNTELDKAFDEEPACQALSS